MSFVTPSMAAVRSLPPTLSTAERGVLEIALVDDHISNQCLIEHALQELDHTIRVIGFTSGAAALNYLCQSSRTDAIHASIIRPPHLVLLDVHMPTISGLAVLKALRQYSGTCRLPVFMCSTDSSPDTLADSRALGANGYIIKPIDFVQLMDTLETVLTFYCDVMARSAKANLFFNGVELHAVHERSEHVGAVQV